MNVVILVSGLPPETIGGAEIQAAGLAANLAPAHHVTVLTRSAAIPAEMAHRPRSEVVRRCRIRLRGLRFGVDVVSTLVILARRRRSVDIIIAYQTVIDGLIAVLAKLLFGIPTLVAVRSELEYQFDDNFQTRVLTPFVFRHADGIAVQSDYIARRFLEALDRRNWRALRDDVARKLCVIPNGVARPSAVPMGGNAVLFVGRLVKVKGVQFLIDAMRSCPGETLVIVGDGPEMKSLQALAAGMPNVSFVGGVAPDRVQDYLAQAKVLVVPSLNEGLPNVILEAMARGVPVIATRGGGIPGVVTHGETGFLTAAGNSRALAEYITLIAHDRDLHARLARNCRAEALRYSWPAVVEIVSREIARIASGALRWPRPAASTTQSSE